jgi:CRP-like cAMP-binding protein
MDGFKKYITELKNGDFVFKQNEEQTNFYIINKGKVQLSIDNGNVKLVTLFKGDFFGEESFNEAQKALFTAEIIEDAALIKIPYPALQDMMKKSSDIALKILKKLSEKHLKITNNLLDMRSDEKTSAKKSKHIIDIPHEDKTSEVLDKEIKAYLIIQRSNRIVQLNKVQTFLGRRDYTTGFIPDIDLTKEDEEKYISRKHSAILYHEKKFYISEESGAVNGTFLNGKKLNTGVKYELHHDDEITLCHLNIIFKNQA